jgi:hypothetical protein
MTAVAPYCNGEDGYHRLFQVEWNHSENMRICMCEVGICIGDGSYGMGQRSAVQLLKKNVDTCGDGIEDHY